MSLFAKEYIVLFKFLKTVESRSFFVLFQSLAAVMIPDFIMYYFYIILFLILL